MDWKTLLPQLLLTVGVIFLGAFAHALKTYLRGGIDSLREYWGPNSWRPTLWTLFTIFGGAIASALSGAVSTSSAEGLLALFFMGFTINSAVNTPSSQVKTTTGAPGTPLAAILGALLLVGLFVPSGAQASTQVVLDCQAPTTRTDNSVFAATEIAGYTFGYTQPATVRVPLLPAVQAPPCHKVVPIAKGQCFKAGTVFDVTVTDNQLIPLTSDPATATLSEDVCNNLPKPNKPTNVLISHD